VDEAAKTMRPEEFSHDFSIGADPSNDPSCETEPARRWPAR
jgi:hypothetical protein